MSSPIDFIQKKEHYNILHHIDVSDTTTFSLTLSPSAFPFNGLCRLQVKNITTVGTGSTNATLNININTTQPYSQSNYPAGSAILNNPNRTLITTTIVSGGRQTSFPPNQYIETQLFSGQTITFTITDATATGFTTSTNWSHIILDLSVKAIN